ncbi:MAG: ABC transporter [Bradyrhizobium icense]|nr:MAG: ABC transporter [Bradyrhizobium icense]
MPGLDPGIHALLSCCQDVDGRDKPGHDEVEGHGVHFGICRIP